MKNGKDYMIQYNVSFDNPHQHIIDVALSVSTGLTAGQKFWLPSWIPGSYMIRDFSRNITEIVTTSNSRPVSVSKLSSHEWCLNENVENLLIEYKVYAWDLSVRSAHFDSSHCFFNGTSCFLAIKGKEEETHHVTLIKPAFPLADNWQVATTMKPVTLDLVGFGDYKSADYAELIDHPFEIADFDEIAFKVNQVTHRMVFVEAPKDVDYQRIASDVRKICQYQCEFFGDSTLPFPRYLFMTFVQKKGFGGLEHRSSTALHCSHADLPRIGEDKKKKSENYQTFLSLCSHEYFHCWNVKRIRPAKFLSYELTQEVNTELLWFFEGITSYYDELILMRSGVISKEQYLHMLAKNITRYLKGKGRESQTLAESSFDAWTKFYKQDENAPNAIVSYYVKGGLVAFCLDFEIRRLTNNDKNLDDLMRMLWREYGSKNRGLKEKEIRDVTERLVAVDMGAFFHKILYATESLQLEAIFDHLDIDYQFTAQTGQNEKGGYLKHFEDRPQTSSLGISHKPNDGGVEVINVFKGESASKAGLANKDIIIAVDGIRVTSEELDKIIARHPISANIEIAFFRRDRLLKLSCCLKATSKNICHLTLKNSTTNSNFEQWSNNQYFEQFGQQSPE